MKAQASTLHFLRRYHKADRKYHKQAKPVQDSALVCKESRTELLAQQTCATGCQCTWGEAPGSAAKLRYQENDLSDSHVSPFNIQYRSIKSCRLEQCSYFILICVIIYTKIQVPQLVIKFVCISTAITKIKTKPSPNNTLLHI